jgi:hypothetical protein
LYERIHFPALRPEHLKDAKLYADRQDLVRHLPVPRQGNICELGVALGEFSAFMIETFQPAQFVAVDFFDLHNIQSLWGKPTREIFGSQTHLAYYKAKFPAATIVQGSSAASLATMPDRHFDLIYIDAGHDYDSVKADALQSMRKIKDGGVIVFNDYVMIDHLQDTPYGVVQVVNEIVTSSDWKVIGFGLQQHMFCDIAIKLNG